MNLTPEQCYAALLARDRRFDGRFFTGVRTTGIYCRPVCPARTPRFENVTFYAHAASAEEAGFRPCRRCRPERAPGSTDWLGTPPVIAKALRLIAAGALDRLDLDHLAEQVAISPRQLRRLFVQHVGATPAAVARSRRAHFARRLLDETNLTATEVAFASGFRSLRAFNETIKATFGRTPTQLRGHKAGSGLTLRLAFRPPLDWDATLAWLTPRLTAGVEQVADATYSRTIAGGVIHVARADDTALALTIDADEPGGVDLLAIVTNVRRMFDLDADPLTIDEHLARDPMLEPVVRAHPGTRVAGGWDAFETAVRTVLGQQISVAAATTLAGRIATTYGKPLDAPHGALTHRFPTPEALADADLRSLGTTTAQQRAIHALARADLNVGEPDLLALPGIGPWSAALIAMRAFGDPDAFPASDLGVLKATGLPLKELGARAEAWRPWRAYAAMYLWRSL